MKCPECGKENTEGSEICTGCGLDLEVLEQQESLTEDKLSYLHRWSKRKKSSKKARKNEDVSTSPPLLLREVSDLTTIHKLKLSFYLILYLATALYITYLTESLIVGFGSALLFLVVVWFILSVTEQQLRRLLHGEGKRLTKEVATQLYSQAILELQAGRTLEALRLFEEVDGSFDEQQAEELKVKEWFEKAKTALYQQSMEQLVKGKYQEAYNTLRHLVDVDPGFKDAGERIAKIELLASRTSGGGIMLCQSCWSESPEGSRFCNQCGTALEVAVDEPPTDLVDEMAKSLLGSAGEIIVRRKGGFLTPSQVDQWRIISHLEGWEITKKWGEETRRLLATLIPPFIPEEEILVFDAPVGGWWPDIRIRDVSHKGKTLRDGYLVATDSRLVFGGKRYKGVDLLT